MDFRGVRLKKLNYKNFPKNFYNLRDAETYAVPLLIGSCEPSKRIVRVGDIVKEGSLIARANGKYGCHIYSPCCGKVVGVVKKLNESGKQCEHVIINRENSDEKLYFPILEASDLNNERLLGRLYDSGLVDNFAPYDATYKKYLLKNKIKTLIINCTETEPYEHAITAMFEMNINEIFEGAMLFKRLCGAENLAFVFTFKQLRLIRLFKKYIKKRGLKKEVKIKIYPHIYPLSYSRLLAYYYCGKMVGDGSRTAQVGVIVEGAINCYDFYQAVYNGKPLIERAVTITGNNCVRKANYIVKNGTPLSHILEVVGFKAEEDKNMVIYGGIMSGITQETPNVSMSLTTDSLLLCQSDEFMIERERICINCGKCVGSCPVKIDVKQVDAIFETRNYSTAKYLHPEACLGCGSCSYVCPAKRNLCAKVQFMKNIALNKVGKNPDDSEYVLVDGIDMGTDKKFDKILDVEKGFEDVKVNDVNPVAQSIIESLKNERLNKNDANGGSDNE